MNGPLYSCHREGSGRQKEKIKLEGEAGGPLEGRPLRWRDEGSQIWREYLYMMGALAPLREQWVALATETPDTCFCLLHLCRLLRLAERTPGHEARGHGLCCSFACHWGHAQA